MSIPQIKEIITGVMEKNSGKSNKPQFDVLIEKVNIECDAQCNGTN